MIDYLVQKMPMTRDQLIEMVPIQVRESIRADEARQFLDDVFELVGEYG